MGTSGTESCEGWLWTQFKHLPPQLALRLSLVRLPPYTKFLSSAPIQAAADWWNIQLIE